MSMAVFLLVCFVVEVQVSGQLFASMFACTKCVHFVVAISHSHNSSKMYFIVSPC